MSTTQLSRRQESILKILVDRTDDDTRLINAEEIVEAVDFPSGTLRQDLRGLRALQLVESIPGSKGGYRPTGDAYRWLDSMRMDRPADVPVRSDGDAMDDVTVTGIDLPTVHSPDLCHAEVGLDGSADRFSEGDTVAIGPTPVAGLQMDGTIADTSPGTITIEVDWMRVG